jgi:hypothetical protein
VKEEIVVAGRKFECIVIHERLKTGTEVGRRIGTFKESTLRVVTYNIWTQIEDRYVIDIDIGLTSIEGCR